MQLCYRQVGTTIIIFYLLPTEIFADKLQKLSILGSLEEKPHENHFSKLELEINHTSRQLLRTINTMTNLTRLDLMVKSCADVRSLRTMATDLDQVLPKLKQFSYQNDVAIYEVDVTNKPSYAPVLKALGPQCTHLRLGLVDKEEIDLEQLQNIFESTNLLQNLTHLKLFDLGSSGYESIACRNMPSLTNLHLDFQFEVFLCLIIL